MNTNLRQYVTRATTTTTTGIWEFLRYIVINSEECYSKQGYFCSGFFLRFFNSFALYWIRPDPINMFMLGNYRIQWFFVEFHSDCLKFACCQGNKNKTGANITLHTVFKLRTIKSFMMSMIMLRQPINEDF